MMVSGSVAEDIFEMGRIWMRARTMLHLPYWISSWLISTVHESSVQKELVSLLTDLSRKTSSRLVHLIIIRPLRAPYRCSKIISWLRFCAQQLELMDRWNIDCEAQKTPRPGRVHCPPESESMKFWVMQGNTVFIHLLEHAWMQQWLSGYESVIRWQKQLSWIKIANWCLDRNLIIIKWGPTRIVRCEVRIIPGNTGIPADNDVNLYRLVITSMMIGMAGSCTSTYEP